MTFSIAGFCARTRMHGVAITTSSICVGARCPWARAGVGAAATQNITDPALGSALLERVALGLNAPQAMQAVIEAHAQRDYRQLTLVDARGETATYTGARTLGTHAVSAARHCVAAGNLLRNTHVPRAMTEAFVAAPDRHLAARLLDALGAGLDAGGEEGSVRSAALLVVHRQPYPLVDLRVDWDDQDPIAALRRLWQAYEPQMDAYMLRALDPAAAPSYGVAGDP